MTGNCSKATIWYRVFMQFDEEDGRLHKTADSRANFMKLFEKSSDPLSETDPINQIKSGFEDRINLNDPEQVAMNNEFKEKLYRYTVSYEDDFDKYEDKSFAKSESTI